MLRHLVVGALLLGDNGQVVLADSSYFQRDPLYAQGRGWAGGAGWSEQGYDRYGQREYLGQPAPGSAGERRSWPSEQYGWRNEQWPEGESRIRSQGRYSPWEAPAAGQRDRVNGSDGSQRTWGNLGQRQPVGVDVEPQYRSRPWGEPSSDGRQRRREVRREGEQDQARGSEPPGWSYPKHSYESYGAELESEPGYEEPGRTTTGWDFGYPEFDWGLPYGWSLPSLQ